MCSLRFSTRIIVLLLRDDFVVVLVRERMMEKSGLETSTVGGDIKVTTPCRKTDYFDSVHVMSTVSRTLLKYHTMTLQTIYLRCPTQSTRRSFTTPDSVTK